MQVLEKQFPSDLSVTKPVIERLKVAVQKELAPKVKDIDKGEYPQEFMHRIGELGGFAQTVHTNGGDGSVKAAVQVIETVSETCLSTGFITWCQIACVWYLQNSDNEYLRQQLLPKVATGRKLAGTGLSNPMKHFAGIEKITLVAERKPGGYVINGMLPWVSNLGGGQVFAIAAQIKASQDYLMAVVSDEFSGVSLRCNAHFIGLEGTNTFSCLFRDVFVPDRYLLATPCEDYVERIKPGFILTQVGMGLGLVKSCGELIKRTNRSHGHVNCFLDDRVEDIEADLEKARLKTYALAEVIQHQQEQLKTSFLAEAIQARINAAELSLRASQAAMLHAGARGYLQGSDYERKVREAYFVAIVTPALKQLKKMLHALTKTAGWEVGGLV